METLLALLFGLLLAAACYMLLAVAVALTGWRMLRGPGIADRAVAMDLLGLLAVSATALAGVPRIGSSSSFQSPVWNTRP